MPIRIGNRVTEKDIRDWLNAQGYEGSSAKITDLELHAIQRPGWVQVFRFCLRVKYLPRLKSPQSREEVQQREWIERFGVVLDDERIRNRELRTRIWIFDEAEKQKQKLDLLSDGLLTCRQGQNGQLIWVVVFILLLLSVAGTVASIIP